MLTLESSHPLGASHTEETVTIKGATSLEVRGWLELMLM